MTARSQGEKIYQSLSVIGRRIEPDKKPEDAAADKDALAGLARWPVTISYFDKVAKKPADDQPGEQTPIYAISFEMYENGISRALKPRLWRLRHRRQDELAGGAAGEGLPVGDSATVLPTRSPKARAFGLFLCGAPRGAGRCAPTPAPCCATI